MTRSKLHTEEIKQAGIPKDFLLDEFDMLVDGRQRAKNGGVANGEKSAAAPSIKSFADSRVVKEKKFGSIVAGAFKNIDDLKPVIERGPGLLVLRSELANLCDAVQATISATVEALRDRDSHLPGNIFFPINGALNAARDSVAAKIAKTFVLLDDNISDDSDNIFAEIGETAQDISDFLSIVEDNLLEPLIKLEHLFKNTEIVDAEGCLTAENLYLISNFLEKIRRTVLQFREKIIALFGSGKKCSFKLFKHNLLLDFDQVKRSLLTDSSLSENFKTAFTDFIDAFVVSIGEKQSCEDFFATDSESKQVKAMKSNYELFVDTVQNDADLAALAVFAPSKAGYVADKAEFGAEAGNFELGTKEKERLEAELTTFFRKHRKTPCEKDDCKKLVDLLNNEFHGGLPVRDIKFIKEYGFVPPEMPVKNGNNGSVLVSPEAIDNSKDISVLPDQKNDATVLDAVEVEVGVEELTKPDSDRPGPIDAGVKLQIPNGLDLNAKIELLVQWFSDLLKFLNGSTEENNNSNVADSKHDDDIDLEAVEGVIVEKGSKKIVRHKVFSAFVRGVISIFSANELLLTDFQKMKLVEFLETISIYVKIDQDRKSVCLDELTPKILGQSFWRLTKLLESNDDTLCRELDRIVSILAGMDKKVTDLEKEIEAAKSVDDRATVSRLRGELAKERTRREAFIAKLERINKEYHARIK